MLEFYATNNRVALPLTLVSTLVAQIDCIECNKLTIKLPEAKCIALTAKFSVNDFYHDSPRGGYQAANYIF